MSILSAVFPARGPSLSGASRAYGLLVPLLLALSACTGPSPRPHWPAEPFPGPRPSGIPQTPAPVPEAREPAEAPPVEKPGVEGPAVTAPPAVLALRQDAAASLEGGDLDGAASALERAIRIQPKNPELWHDLAEVRLKQQQPVLAEELAKKSNAHARGSAALIRSNWAIIAEARRLKGDTEGAADAAVKAGR